MARHTGVAWRFNGREIEAVLEDGRVLQIAKAFSVLPIVPPLIPTEGFRTPRPAEIQANGHMLASALALATALGELLEASAPLLGDDDPRVIQARELVSSLVEERLK